MNISVALDGNREIDWFDYEDDGVISGKKQKMNIIATKLERRKLLKDCKKEHTFSDYVCAGCISFL